MYSKEIVTPMKEELTLNGFQDLVKSNDVEEILKKDGTTLIVINSICGCSAGAARPGVLMSLSNNKKPDNLSTAFAGFDFEAVEKAREHMLPFPPSSPSVALFKNGELVHFVERHNIEGNTAELISENLKAAYDKFC